MPTSNHNNGLAEFIGAELVLRRNPEEEKLELLRYANFEFSSFDSVVPAHKQV